MAPLRVLELFSGIGGMHFALKDSGVEAEVAAAVDVNTVANAVYRHNFPGSKLMQNNVQCITEQMFDKLSPQIILMSPPCQPFTRQGLQKDTLDPRSNALMHLVNLLSRKNTSLEYVLLENVKGFENSDCRDAVVKSLKSAGFSIKELLISPDQTVGMPNSRLRYYLLARKQPWDNSDEDFPARNLPEASKTKECFEIGGILEWGGSHEERYSDYLVPKDTLDRRGTLLDIVYSHSRRSCCFTKGYSRYAEGTGSVYSPSSEEDVKLAFSANSLDAIARLNLRFFTPREVARLMGFPEEFDFPKETTLAQTYRLLGNSINVKIVSELIKLLLINNPS